MAPAAARTPRGDLSADDYLTKLEQANVVNSIENLMTFPRVAALINSGALIAHGAYFGVATGELSVLDRASGAFVPVAAEQHAKAFGAPRF